MSYCQSFYLLTVVLAFVHLSHQALPLNSPCSPTASNQCGHNAVCPNSTNRCECFFGYTPDPDGINCQQFPCKLESDCTNKYGPHSICIVSDNHCDCDIESGWIINMQTLNSCAPGSVLLNHTCASKNDCGSWAFCDLQNDLKCKCDLGFEPDLKGEINCFKINCKTDADCAQSDPHAQCDTSALIPCGCNYDSGYVKDFDTQRCLPRNQFIGKSCSTASNFTCGTGAFCDIWNSQNSCKCRLGYIPKANQMDCSQIKCTTDAQCEQLNPNSKCFESENCICKLGYKLDWDRQVCVYSSAISLWSNLNLLISLIVMLLYNFL